MHLFIYLFFFYFLLQKDSTFSNMFCNENNFKKLLYFYKRKYQALRGFASHTTIWLVQMGPQINGLLLRAASRSSGRVSALAALPCPTLPCPGTALFLSPQTDTTFALNIGTGSDWKNLPGTAQFLSTQTDTTMVALIYKIRCQFFVYKVNPMDNMLDHIKNKIYVSTTWTY